VNTFRHTCGAIDPGSCIRGVPSFGIKNGYDSDHLLSGPRLQTSGEEA
jgi:hypothetical protein